MELYIPSKVTVPPLFVYVPPAEILKPELTDLA